MSNREVVKKIEERGLSVIYTGGGYNYPWFTMDKTSESAPNFTVSVVDHDFFPDNLQQKASVIVYTGTDWCDHIELGTRSVSDCIEAIGDSDFRSACIWNILSMYGEGDVDNIINSYIDVSAEQEAIRIKSDCSMQDWADSYIKDKGFAITFIF